MQCEAVTRKKIRCPIQDAAFDSAKGVWHCHVHHSARTFQAQLAATKDWKAESRKNCRNCKGAYSWQAHKRFCLNKDGK